jgi:hypothetical protein
MKLLLEIILLGITVGCLEMAFQHYMWPNNIFYPYGYLLAKVGNVNSVLLFVASPLGRCPYCNGTWIAFYAYKYFYGINLPVLLCIGVVMITVSVIKEKIFLFSIDSAVKIDEVLEIERRFIKSPWPILGALLLIGWVYFVIYVIVPILK